MPLPDISRFASRADVLRDLGRTLRRIGVSLASATPIVTAAALVPAAHRKPIRAYHLRKLNTASGYAMRMFMFRDPVTADEAKAALGDSVGALLDVGLLVRGEDGTIVSPFVLGVLDDMYILFDDLSHGSDAVMGFGETTIALSSASVPRNKLGRMLDLGCGSGTGGLLLSRRVKDVVATDINPRATALTRANAVINELGRIDVREGDLFAPVAGETFDLIISQPPFVAKPEGVPDASFLYGGARGDEIALDIVRNAPKHLAPGGRAVLLVEWPVYDDEEIEARLRAVIGAGPNLLVLQGPGVGIDSNAAAYAAGLHPDLGPSFDAAARARREHFDRQGIRDLVPTIVVIEQVAPGARGWTSTVHTQPFGSVSFSSDRIDKIIAARAIAGDRARVLGAKLRVPASTRFTQEQIGPGAEVPSTIAANFAPQALIQPIGLTLELLGLVTFVHEAETAREGIERFAEALEMPLDRALEEGGQAVTDMLVHGFLEVDAA